MELLLVLSVPPRLLLSGPTVTNRLSNYLIVLKLTVEQRQVSMTLVCSMHAGIQLSTLRINAPKRLQVAVRLSAHLLRYC